MSERKTRPKSPGVTRDVDAMIRVDHAGEYGAVRIYEGQMAVFGDSKSNTANAIRHMAEQEQVHLQAFDELINERRVRPTALEPLWRVAGFALGAATALMGEKAAMACTAAVEDVIDQHYKQQVAKLDADPVLKEKIEAFRADEIAHKQEAIAQGAEEAPAYKFLSESIKAGCRLAIMLSEKI